MLALMGALAFLGGALNAMQSGANATLAKALHQPFTAAVVIALVGCSVYLVAGCFYGLALPDR